MGRILRASDLYGTALARLALLWGTFLGNLKTGCELFLEAGVSEVGLWSWHWWQFDLPTLLRAEI